MDWIKFQQNENMKNEPLDGTDGLGAFLSNLTPRGDVSSGSTLPPFLVLAFTSQGHLLLDLLSM